jgi:hypothetical protein
MENTSESEGLPATSDLAPEGSVGESDTELQGQEVLFPPLVNCTDPVTCILAKFTTRLVQLYILSKLE